MSEREEMDEFLRDLLTVIRSLEEPPHPEDAVRILIMVKNMLVAWMGAPPTKVAP